LLGVGFAGRAQVYAGPLSGGAYVFGLLNRGTTNATIDAKFTLLEKVGVGEGTAACARELFSGRTMQVKGSVSWSVRPHDIAIVRVKPGATSC
jgi:alpha-galactosidase